MHLTWFLGSIANTGTGPYQLRTFLHTLAEHVVDVCAVIVLLWNVAKCVGQQIAGWTDAWDFDHVVSEVITAECAVSCERNLSVEVYVV